ncbi:MAG TPA: beta-ketoacyl synthase N-terminal-like domain-containing protein [Polyangia bacterium]|jgi:3-oxoacyl-[acyl-carrier-protein] synthase-1|nr:beta-ketoacyl synthase N-terminal-like domain-containing protein [Polyangia bacterium]
MVITAACCRTSIGLTAEATAAAARAGISRVKLSESFDDLEGNPIAESRLRWTEAPPEEPAAAAEPDHDDTGQADEPRDAADGPDQVDAEVDEDAADAASPALDSEEVDDELETEESADGEPDDEADAGERVGLAARQCLADLLAAEIDAAPGLRERPWHLLLGVAVPTRPGPRYEGGDRTLGQLLRHWPRELPRPAVEIVSDGNASGVRALHLARQILQRDPQAICIVGAIDSLLDEETVAWLESAERLRSETFGRNQGMAPGEAVGFLLLEDPRTARGARRPALAEVVGLGLASEPAPFLSEAPSRSEGLTLACRAALEQARRVPSEIGLVIGDLDGELHRSREWAHVDLRLFDSAHPARELWHPAEYFGSVGAASGVVLAAIAAVLIARGWLPAGPALVFTSDDSGPRGCAILAATSPA